MNVPSSFLADRTRHFTGRQWVFDAIGAWLSDKAGARAFLLTGGPGTGKTTIAARIAQMDAGLVTPAVSALSARSLTYAHFCQAGVEPSLSPAMFVRALSEALANRYAAFRAALIKAGSRQIAINAVPQIDTVAAGGQAIGAQMGRLAIDVKGGDARSVFDAAIGRPIRELGAALPRTERIVILVDSLDEALRFGADDSIGQLLGVANDLPPQVRFILTSRSDEERVFDQVGPSRLDLIANAPFAVDEVGPYVLARLSDLPQPARGKAARRIAVRSEGNFLYAHHLVNGLLSRDDTIPDADTLDLPDSLEGVYRADLERAVGADRARWSDAYRPILGAIAVARGEGLTREQLMGITGLPEETLSEVFDVCAPFLAGGCDESTPYRIGHESFRDFLLDDRVFTVFPDERHAAIARYLQDRHGTAWSRCDEEYALRYTPAHWADAAALSPPERGARTLALIDLVSNRQYQHRFEARVADLPMLHAHLHRALHVAALNDRIDMLPAIVRAAKECLAFRRGFLRAESVVALAELGRLDHAEGRLELFSDIDADWHTAARLILAWLAAGRNLAAATALRDATVTSLPDVAPLPLLRDRLNAALAGQPVYAAIEQPPIAFEHGRELVNRISGQACSDQLLTATDAAPALVNLARVTGADGTRLVDEYVDAHAGCNYIEYRNRSLWNVLKAVLRHHSSQPWVLDRLRHLLASALSRGGVDFEEMLPMTAAVVAAQVHNDGNAPGVLASLHGRALSAAAALRRESEAGDSWGNHRRRLTAIMELCALVMRDGARARAVFNQIQALPDGFAGFQAPARLREADALRACRMDRATIDATLQAALLDAHHIQDHHACARITARCNALMRWHRAPLAGADLAAAISRLARGPNDAEFAADFVIGEPYALRSPGPGVLSLAIAQHARTLDNLVEVFQRSTVEFHRLNPGHLVTAHLPEGLAIRVPDPGFPPLLAIHFAARAFADDALGDHRAALIRSLVPVAAVNATALDTLLAYLVIAADLHDADLVDEIAAFAGAPVPADAPAPSAAIGPTV
jgi:hypothetical protein